MPCERREMDRLLRLNGGIRPGGLNYRKADHDSCKPLWQEASADGSIKRYNSMAAIPIQGLGREN